MRPVGFGVLGCGGIGSWHARQLLALPSANLVAMADPDAAARQRVHARLKVPVHAEVRDLLRDPKVEVVSICTPPATHVDLAEQAAEAGKHVLVEKPLALDAAAARGVVELCARRRVLLGAVHQQRTQTACLALKRLIEIDTLGTLYYAVASLSWYRPAAATAGHAWRGRDLGGGLLLDAGVHLVDLLLWLLGPVEGVTAQGDGGEPPRTVSALLLCRSGVAATLALSFAGNLYRDDVAIEIVGSRGGCRLEIRDHDHAEIVRLDLAAAEGARAGRVAADGIRQRLRDEGGGWRDGPRNLLWRQAARLLPERGRYAFTSPVSILQRQVDRRAQADRGEPQGHAAVLAQMAGAVRGGVPPLATGEDACAALAVIDAIGVSIAGGGRRVAPAGFGGGT